jgi:hypothetical protein
MAAEVKTGMDKAEMKKLLVKSKQEPVNCAIGVGSDAGFGLLLLHRIKQPRALMQELEKTFPDAKNPRYGTAMVDTDEDPKLVKFYLNKPVSGMARRLIKTLKGTGFSKARIMLEDGSDVEVAGEEEEEETAGAETQEETARSAAPPNATAPDAASLTRELTDLVKRMMAVIGADPSRKDALVGLAGAAQGGLKGGDPAAAAAGIEALRQALDAQPSATRSAATQPAPGGGAVAYAKSRLAWLAARKKVESEIDKLRSEIIATYQADGIAAEIEKRYRERVAPVLGTLDESLADKLEEATNATDAAQRAKLVEEAKQIMQRYETYLAGEKIIADLDSNPFVPLAIQQTISATLTALSKAVH